MGANQFFAKKCEPEKWTAATGVRTRELGGVAERGDGLNQNVSKHVSARPFGACRSLPFTGCNTRLHLGASYSLYLIASNFST